MKILCKRCSKTFVIYEEPPEWGICPECYEEDRIIEERRQHGNKKPMVKNT
jgi:hypothetical protein